MTHPLDILVELVKIASTKGHDMKLVHPIWPNEIHLMCSICEKHWTKPTMGDGDLTFFREIAEKCGGG